MGCISGKRKHSFGYSTDPVYDMHQQKKNKEQTKKKPELDQRHYIKTQQYLVVPKESAKIQFYSEQKLELNDINQNSLIIKRKQQHKDEIYENQNQ